MVSFQEAVISLQRYGIADVLLPFLLIYTVTFAILQKVQILGQNAKRFNVIIALVIALSVIIPHVTGTYPPNADVVNIINTAIPNVSVFIVALLMLFLLIGLWGGKPTWVGKGVGWVSIIALLLVAYIFARAAGWAGQLPSWLYFLDDPGTLSLLIVIAVFAIVIAYITAEERPAGAQGSFERFREGLGDLFGRRPPGG